MKIIYHKKLGIDFDNSFNEVKMLQLNFCKYYKETNSLLIVNTNVLSFLERKITKTYPLLQNNTKSPSSVQLTSFSHLFES